MEHRILLRSRSALGLASALTIAIDPGSALAAGVSAGTLIQATATATFSTGGSNSTIQSNTVTVRVDELLDFAVTGLASAPVSTGSAGAVLIYAVTNTGNGPEAFKLTVDPAVPGNPFDAVVQSIAIDSNGNNAYDPGVDQTLLSGTAAPPLIGDETQRVFVVVTLPASALEGQTSQIRLKAEAMTGTGAPGTVFAGQGMGGGDAVVGASGASSFGLNTISASLASVSLAKSASVRDPYGNAQPMPGAIVTYTVVATVSGSGNAENLRVTDVIPSGTTYQAGTLKLGGAALTDASDGDAGTASASGIAVDLGSVAGGSSRTVTFDVKIN